MKYNLELNFTSNTDRPARENIVKLLKKNKKQNFLRK